MIVMDAGWRRHALRPRLKAAVAISFLLLAALLLGFIGWLAPPFDSFSHFRAHLAVLLALMAPLLLWWRVFWLAGACGVGALAGLFFSLPFLLPAPVTKAPAGAPVYALLQINLRWDSEDHTPVLQRIAQARPDIVTLQEMTPSWRASAARLSTAYPHQLHCENADGFLGDSAILSRRPFVNGEATVCDRRNSFASARIDFNGIALTVVSHHQLWPWPDGSWRRLGRLRETLGALQDPMLIAGDFNAAPWSALVSDYGALTGTRVARGIGATWLPQFLPAGWRALFGLPIDNVLTSPSVQPLSIERLDPIPSDHLPVLVTFTLENDRPNEPTIRIVESTYP